MPRLTLKNIKHIPKPIVSLAVLLIKGWSRTFRLRVDDPNGILTGAWDRPAIYVFWHNRLLCLPALFPRRIRKQVAILISRSRDGNYISSFAEEFQLLTIRGSTSKGGRQALLQLMDYLKSGKSIGITPDGPRGPRYAMQDGAVWLAAKTGVPIFPVSLNTTRHLSLKGWDRTQIPWPFTTAELIISDPINIPPCPRESQLAEWTKTVHDRLSAITRWD